MPATYVGVFTSLSKLTRSGEATVAATVEDLGYGALWVANVVGDLTFLRSCLAATSRIRVGSAVLSMWDLQPEAAAAAWAAAEQQGGGRAVIGVGASHPSLAQRAGHVYDKPLSRLRDYLHALDECAPPVPVGSRILGANGPQMLRLAAEHSAGALTQLVTPERTAEHRTALGAGATLAAEVKVVLADDRDSVFRLGRDNLRHYLGLPAYRTNLARMGFDDADFGGDGSDRLVDALVAGPSVEAIRARIEEHREAGADHICVHVLSDDDGVPLEALRQLAPILTVTP